MSEGYAIGIDLGTTYSRVCVLRNEKVETVINRQGNRITPSYVAFTETERLIGDSARNQGALNPDNTIFDVKRLIGRRFNDETVQCDMKLWPFKVVRGREDRPMIVAKYKGEEKLFTAEEISSMVLTEMKEIAQRFLGCEVFNVVITVPAYFTDTQRRATMDAATIAGFNVLEVISEPSAAALAYAYNENINSSQKWTALIFDIGAGTFDVSVVRIENGVVDVMATAGDTHFGGEDFDNRIVDHFVKEFKRRENKDVSHDQYALRRLKTECEKVKQNLYYVMEVPVFIECFYEGVDLNSRLSRAKFESLNIDLFKKCLVPVEQCLNDANISKSAINEVLLVGGSTLIPKVRELMKNYFDGKTHNESVNPDEVVAYGAAIQAAKLGGNPHQKTSSPVVMEVTPLSVNPDAGRRSLIKSRHNNKWKFCRTSIASSMQEMNVGVTSPQTSPVVTTSTDELLTDAPPITQQSVSTESEFDIGIPPGYVSDSNIDQCDLDNAAALIRYFGSRLQHDLPLDEVVKRVQKVTKMLVSSGVPLTGWVDGSRSLLLAWKLRNQVRERSIEHDKLIETIEASMVLQSQYVDDLRTQRVCIDGELSTKFLSLSSIKEESALIQTKINQTKAELDELWKKFAHVTHELDAEAKLCIHLEGRRRDVEDQLSSAELIVSNSKKKLEEMKSDHKRDVDEDTTNIAVERAIKNITSLS